jgi:hypothetical protein
MYRRTLGKSADRPAIRQPGARGGLGAGSGRTERRELHHRPRGDGGDPTRCDGGLTTGGVSAADVGETDRADSPLGGLAADQAILAPIELSPLTFTLRQPLGSLASSGLDP